MNWLTFAWISIIKTNNNSTLLNIRRVSSVISLNCSYIYLPQTSDIVVWYLTCVRVSCTTASHSLYTDWSSQVSRLRKKNYVWLILKRNRKTKQLTVLFVRDVFVRFVCVNYRDFSHNQVQHQHDVWNTLEFQRESTIEFRYVVPNISIVR